MSLVLIGITILIGAVLLYYLLFKNSSKVQESNATATCNTKEFGQAHISIKSPGGFDHLCVNNLACATIGANMTLPKFKDSKFVLKEEPSLSDINELKSQDNGMECLILVEVHCIGINYADCCIRWGLYESAKEYVGYPITPGFEFSGKVIKILGNQSSKSLMKFKKGDEVFGVSLFGAYSTHILVPNHQLFHKPSTIDMAEAGGYLVTLFTAYYGLFNLAGPTMLPHIIEAIDHKTKTFYESVAMNEMTSDLFEESKNIDSNNSVNDKIVGKGNVIDKQSSTRPITSVLIHSASGGVGSVLVQLCKKIAKFDIVVGVVGGQHKIEFAKKMGCDFVIDRKDIKNLENGNIWDEMNNQIDIQKRYGGFDVIFDANGIATLSNSYKFLKPTGRLITYGFHTMLPHSGTISPLQWIKLGYNALMTPKYNPMKLVQENKGILGFNLSFLFSRYEILNDVMANAVPWIEDRILKPPKVTLYRFEDVAKAHRDIQSGKTVGKLVLVTKHANIDIKKRQQE